MPKLIGFMGAPGTGKTTLACALKEYLMTKGVSSDVCTEYAREFVYEYGHPTDPYVQYRISGHQKRREDTLMKGNVDYVFSDSPVWLAYIYTLKMLSGNHQEEMTTLLAEMYDGFVLSNSNRYHKVFYLENDTPLDDGCKEMDENKRIADMMRGFRDLHMNVLPIEIIHSPIDNPEKRKEAVWKSLINDV